MKPIVTKQIKPLPDRKAMQALAQSGTTINDYSKVSPLDTSTPNVIENLRMAKQ